MSLPRRLRGRCVECPRQESNLRTRFRNLLAFLPTMRLHRSGVQFVVQPLFVARSFVVDCGDGSSFAPSQHLRPAAADDARVTLFPLAAARSPQGPRYLRWALVEAATHACTHPAYRECYQRTKTRLGKQRGAKVARVLSRRA